jgi:type I restriction enzyme R subunit
MYTLKAERTAWLEAHPEPWSLDDEIAYHRLFSQPIFDWLDEHLGSCPLRSESARDLLRAVLGRFEEVNYRSFAWVIMPNHVHGLFALLGETLLQEQVKAWKGVSAREILRGSDGGILWQKDYFDRLIRDEQHFWRVADYIRKNPARLPAGDFWHWEHAEVTAHFNGNGGIAFGCLTAPAADSEPLRPLMQNAQHRR